MSDNNWNKKPTKFYITATAIVPQNHGAVIAEIDQVYTSLYKPGQIITTVPLLAYTISGSVVSPFAP